MKVILGISPGTQAMGIAVFRNGVLVDWRVLSFKGSWNKQKLKSILDSVTELINEFAITSIAIRLPNAERSSDGLDTLVAHLHQLAKAHKIPLHAFAMSDLKKQKDITKRTLIKQVAEKYPELAHEYLKAHRKGKEYYEKLFIAVAVAVKAIESN
jgi:hypothetical protein